MEQELRNLGVRLTNCGINVIDEEAGEWRGFFVIAETVRLDAPHINDIPESRIFADQNRRPGIVVGCPEHPLYRVGGITFP